MMARGLSLVLLAAAAGAQPQKTEKDLSNELVAQAPAYSLTNVTVSMNLVMAATDRANCYNSNGDGFWNREVFRTAAGQAFNALSELQFAREVARTNNAEQINGNLGDASAWTLWLAADPDPHRPNIHDNIYFDRVVESSRPFLDTQNLRDFHLFAQNVSDVAQNHLFPATYWNVMLRFTFIDVPANVVVPSAENPSGFRGFRSALLKPLAGTVSGTYTESGRCPQTALVPNSLWISTDEHFLPDRLEPVVGRGNANSQSLLIPLVMGLAMMLLIPILIVTILVTVAQQRNTNEAAILKKEEEALKKERSVAGLSERIHIYQTTEEIKLAKKLEERKKEQAERKAEIDALDCRWVKRNEPAY